MKRTGLFSPLKLVAFATAFVSISVGAQTIGSSPTPAEHPDVAFIQEAGAGGLAEVELSQLALSTSASPSVKSFARQMIDAHTANNKELLLIATKENVRAPTQIDAEHARLKSELATKRGPDFDRAYIDAMRTDHMKMAALLEQTAGSATNEDIKTFAQKTLPVVQHHLQMAQALTAS